MSSSFTQVYTVSSERYDAKGFVNLLTQLRLLHQAAHEHAAQLGINSLQLTDYQLTWALLSMEVHVLQSVRLLPAIRVRTEAAQLSPRILERNYQLYAGNRLCLVATSTWGTLNLETRSLAALPERLRLNRRAKAERDFHSGNITRLRTATTGSVLRRETYTVGYYDCDFNAHLNSIAAVRILLEAIYRACGHPFIPDRITISYRREIAYGAKVTIIVSAGDTGNTIDASLIGADTKPAILLRIIRPVKTTPEYTEP